MVMRLFIRVAISWIFVFHFMLFYSYKLRIECMLLKEEWASTAGYLESAINAILVAGDDLMSSRSIQVYFLFYLLSLLILCIVRSAAMFLLILFCVPGGSLLNTHSRQFLKCWRLCRWCGRSQIIIIAKTS